MERIQEQQFKALEADERRTRRCTRLGTIQEAGGCFGCPLPEHAEETPSEAPPAIPAKRKGKGRVDTLLISGSYPK
jgi:hypothetical protein